MADEKDKRRPVPDLYKQIDLTSEKAKKIGDELSTNVKNALADRQELEKRWERAIKLFEGKREEKKHPWVGAANNHLPLVASNVAALHARFMTNLYSPEPFWRVKAKSPEYQDFCEQATNYLDWSSQNEFPWYEAVRDFALDATKLGLGILEITWKHQEGWELHYDKDYNIVEELTTIEDRPHVEAVPPDKFVWTSGYENIQTCPWVCRIRNYSPGQLRQLIKEKWLREDPTNKIVSYGANTADTQVGVARSEAEGVWPNTRDVYELYHIWGKYDYNNDGYEEEIEAVVDPMTGFLLRFNLNPYFHRRRPFVIGRLEVREHSVAGLGVADMIGDLNEEINTIHNQTVDATTASIIQMWAVRVGSPAEDALENIWPSKKIPVHAIDDVKELGLGPLKATSVPLEAVARDYSERRTGISDFSQGREPTPSRRGTATGTLAIIQEGNKKFDFQTRDMRKGLSDAGMMILELIQQMNPKGVIRDVLGPESEAFSSLSLTFPDKPLRSAISMEVAAGTASSNRQVQRQDGVTLFQLMTQFYMQALQLGQMLAQPGLPPALIQMGVEIGAGAQSLMKEILASFENRRTDELLPDLEEIYTQLGQFGLQQTQMMQQQQMMAQLSGQGGQSGTQQGAGGGPSGGQGNRGMGAGGQAPQRPGGQGQASGAVNRA